MRPTLRKAVMLDSPRRSRTSKTPTLAQTAQQIVDETAPHVDRWRDSSPRTPRRAASPRSSAHSAQEIADQTAERLRTAAERGNPTPTVRQGGAPMSGSEMVNIFGSRREITLESLAYPALTGQRRGAPASGTEPVLGEKMAAKASRIAKVALDPHASPADRMDASAWCRRYIGKVLHVEAITAAGRALAEE